MKIEIGRFKWTSRADHRRLAVLMGVALIGLAAGIMVLVGIVRFPAPTPRASDHAPDTLNFVQASGKMRRQILDEEARLLDPTPLFLPTSYNYSRPENTDHTLRETEQSFSAYPALFAYNETNFSLPFPDPVRLPAQPVDVLDYGQTQPPYATLGRGEIALTPLSPRLGFVEVVSMKTGRMILSLTIPRPEPQPADLPDALATGDLWSPLEFLTVVDVTGLVGSPMLMKGSAPPALARYLAAYLEKDLHIGAHRELSAGTYVIRVGP